MACYVSTRFGLGLPEVTSSWFAKFGCLLLWLPSPWSQVCCRPGYDGVGEIHGDQNKLPQEILVRALRGFKVGLQPYTVPDFVACRLKCAAVWVSGPFVSQCPSASCWQPESRCKKGPRKPRVCVLLVGRSVNRRYESDFAVARCGSMISVAHLSPWLAILCYLRRHHGAIPCQSQRTLLSFGLISGSGCDDRCAMFWLTSRGQGAKQFFASCLGITGCRLQLREETSAQQVFCKTQFLPPGGPPFHGGFHDQQARYTGIRLNTDKTVAWLHAWNREPKLWCHAAYTKTSWFFDIG